MAQRRTWRRLAFAGALLAVALSAGGLGLWRWRRTPPPPAYTTAVVRRGDVVARVTASGTLRPAVLVEVGSLVSGRVKELFADFNTPVKAGDVLARLDPLPFETAVSLARARLASAEAGAIRARANADQARTRYDRLANLLARGAVTRAEAEDALAARKAADADVAAARAGITEARAQLAQAKVNLDYATVTSPVNGIVIARRVEVGQSVSASMTAPVLFVLAGDLHEMVVHTSVAESDVGRIAAGQKVEFTVDAYPGETFAGEVAEVRHEATTISNVVTYDALVRVRNDALKLRPGMTANVTFVLAERRGVLAVPNRALRWRPRGAGRAGERPGSSSAAVWTLRDGQPERVKVVPGLTDGTSTEVTSSDLSEGDVVITGEPGGTGAPRDGARPPPMF